MTFAGVIDVNIVLPVFRATNIILEYETKESKMQENSYYICIDVGTQGMRCGIVCDNGEILTTSETNYEIYFPQPGYAMQRPTDWLDSSHSVLKKCVDSVSKSVLDNIKGLSICATASTVIPVDKYGNALSDAILWMDNRAKKEAEAINHTKHPILKYCGGEVSVEWLIPKILWLKKNETDVYDNAYRIVEQLDFMNYHLTGSWVSSVCQATCKGNYAEDIGGWDSEYFNLIGLPDYKEKLNTNVWKLAQKVGHILP